MAAVAVSFLADLETVRIFWEMAQQIADGVKRAHDDAVVGARQKPGDVADLLVELRQRQPQQRARQVFRNITGVARVRHFQRADKLHHNLVALIDAQKREDTAHRLTSVARHDHDVVDLEQIRGDAQRCAAGAASDRGGSDRSADAHSPP